jgi:hypothetical protein
MRRSLLILVSLLLASATVVVGSYLVGQCVCTAHLAHNTDDLDWLRREFHLNDAELQRVRQLHEGYLPKCREVCGLIAAKKKELQAVLDLGQGVTPEAEKKLAEVAALRTRCQTQMLRHFGEVSQAMPPEQGRRYLAEMQRMTLGSHEQIEHKMSHEMPSPDGHR